MVLRYDSETIEEYLSSKTFLDNFTKKYTNEKSKKQLINFLDNIDTNKKYYKLGINKSKKFKRVENTDTSSIKNINSFINKITNENYETIKNSILPLLKTHYLSYVIENIIEKSLMHHIYIHLYVLLINDISKKYDINILLNKEINKIYNNLIQKNNQGDTYQDLCNRNNNIDKLCGLTLLISNLEKNNKIDKNTNVITNDLLTNINYDDLDYIYKTLLCIQNMFQINKSLVVKFKEKLIQIQKNKINSKIKFKIMDILDI